MQSSKPQKSYESPTLKKLEAEEAKQFLAHHANIGDTAAKEVLELVSPRSQKPGS